MTTYSQLVDNAGVARIDQVRRDDGVFVLTGILPFGDEGHAVPEFDDPDGLAYQAWLASGNELGAPIAPVATFPDISDRQCFEALANLGKISEDEAVAAVSTGQLPKVVTDGIAQIPVEQRFPARMLLCGATTFHRAHPMVVVFGSFFGMGAADLDALWQAAEAL